MPGQQAATGPTGFQVDRGVAVSHAWVMRRSLLLASALLLMSVPAWADEHEGEATPEEGAEARDVPIELDLSWNPARSAETDFAYSEQAATAPATLRVLCIADGARVQVDGQAYGEAPRVISGIEPGVHAVTVELPSGRSFTRQVFLRGGSVEELTVHPGGTRDEEAAFVIRTISSILATLVAIPASATDSARLGREVEMPGLITNLDVLEPVPQE